MRPRLKLVASLTIAAVCLATVAAGCGGSGNGDEGRVDREGLSGRSFASTEVSGRELVPGTEVSISFKGGTLNAAAGCNGMFGRFQLDGDRLTVPMTGSTQMGCEPDRHEQDQWLSDFLADGATIELDGNQLTLTGDDATIVLHEPGGGEPTITGITWQLGIIVDPRDVASGVPGGRKRATLTIASDGRIAYTSGCNGGSGTVEIGADTVLFKRASWTEMHCRGPTMKVERAMRKVFDGEAAMSTGRHNLILTRRGTSLTFRPR